jgi:hypothetical protein
MSLHFHSNIVSSHFPQKQTLAGGDRDVEGGLPKFSRESAARGQRRGLHLGQATSRESEAKRFGAAAIPPGPANITVQIHMT